jgi:hypothetical protein
MFKAIFGIGGVFIVATYFASKYALKQLQAKQNPLAPFGQ